MTDQSSTPRRIPGPVTATQLPPHAYGGMGGPGISGPVTAPERTPAQALTNVEEKYDRAFAARSLPMQPTSIGKIAGAIAGVMSEVGVVDKGGHNKFHNYSYARMEDVLKAVTPLMGKHGLAVIQNEVDRGFVEDKVIVTYEFSIIHSSGEFWPERPRFTGMCRKNLKDGLDDKAINKCHTAARKYFLLSLFQVPTGDLDDADEGPAPKQEAQRRTVPGPTSRPIDEGKPRKIVLGEGTGADQWANAYIKAIKGASTDELSQWDTLNDGALQNLADRYSAIYGQITTAVEKRYAELSPRTERIDQETGEVLDEQQSDIPGRVPRQDREAERDMPDPASDAQMAVNWVAQRLTLFKTMDAAGAFWDEVVVPRAREFQRVDFDLLQGEWRRCEARLAGS